MKTREHQVNRTIIPAGLDAKILECNASGFGGPSYKVFIPALDFTYWTYESNMRTWGEMDDFTQEELNIFEAGNKRKEQLNGYYNGTISLKVLDIENPLKQLFS